jgi:hypothetical protein
MCEHIPARARNPLLQRCARSLWQQCGGWGVGGVYTVQCGRGVRGGLGASVGEGCWGLGGKGGGGGRAGRGGCFVLGVHECLSVWQAQIVESKLHSGFNL